MQKSALLAAFLLCVALLPAQAPQYFFQKLNCDTGNTMCFDADSNIWLGCSRAGQPLLVKMSREGILLEQVQVSTGAGLPNAFTDLMCDSEGMLVGCGVSEPIDFNMPEASFAFRYDPKTRQLLWSRKLNDEFLFANGLTENGPGGHFWMYCYRPNLSSVGDILLLNRNTGDLVPEGSRSYQMGNDENIRSALYHKGKLYTAGVNDLGFLYGITIRRYQRQSIACIDTAGIPVWSLLGSVPVAARSALVGQDLLVENDTLVSLASGNDLTNATTSGNLFLQKTTLDGTSIWLKKYDLTSLEYPAETGQSIVSVSDGYVILGQNSSGGSAFVIKTDKNGNLLWAQKLGNMTLRSSFYGKSQSLMLTDGDAIYIIGSEQIGLQSAAVFAKIDRNGNIAGCNRISPLTVLPVPLITPFFEKRTLKSSTADNAVSEDTPSELLPPAPLGISVVCQNEGPAPQNPCEPRTFLKRLGNNGLRQWVTCIRTAPDTTLYLAGRKGNHATLTKMRPDGEVLWIRTMPSSLAYTITDLLVDHQGMLVGCGHRNDVPTQRIGFVFRYNPTTDQVLWLRWIEGRIASGGGIVQLKNNNRDLLLYQNALLPDGRQVPQSVQLNHVTGDVVPLTGRGYDSETHSQVFHAAVLSDADLYTIGQDVAVSGRRRMLMSNLTPVGGGQKWLQVGHTDTTAVGSFGDFGAVIFDQSHAISAYTGHPTANGATAPTQLFLQKTTPLGTVLWVRRYEVPLLGEVDLLAVPGGYVLMGKTSPTRYVLLKTDLNGNLLAAKQVEFGTVGGTPVSLEKTQHRIAVLGQYLFFALHDGRADVAFLLKTDLNLDVQGPCNGVTVATLVSGNVVGPVATRLQQGLFAVPFTATLVPGGAWQPDDLAVTLVCPPPVVVPRVALGPDRSLCPGKTLTLQAPAGLVSYLWQDGSTALSLTVSASGEYSVATLDICGRVQRDTVQVTMLSNPTKSVTLALKPNSSVSLGGKLYFAPDTVTVTEPSFTGGCDTLTTYFLELCPVKSGVDTLSFYPGQKVTLGGNNYAQPGTVVLNFFTPDGCDSIVTYTLQWIITSLNLQCAADLTVNVPLGTDRIAVDYALPIFATDCPNPDVGLALLEGLFAADTFPLGVTKVCYAAVSSCGIRDTCCFRVTVLPPALELEVQCPASLTVSVPTVNSTASVNYAMPSATTDCSDPAVLFALLQGLPSGAAFPVGNTQVCYEAANTCGISDTCCFAVRVLLAPPDPPCDVKTPPGCIRYELLGVRLDSLGQRRYRVRMVNTCASPLQFAYLQLPNGVVAVSPKEGATYTAPSGNAYAVRNPNASPFYSVRYKAVAGNVSGGAGDVFEYTLPQQAAPGFLHVAARLADGAYSEAYLDTYGCPEVMENNIIENLELRIEDEIHAPFSILHSQLPRPPFSILHSQLPRPQFSILHSQLPRPQFSILNSQLPRPQFSILNSQLPRPQFSILNSQLPRSPLLVRPNPTSGLLSVDLGAWHGQQVEIQVLNAQGQLALSQHYIVENEWLVLDLPNALVSGLYYLVVGSEVSGDRATVRFVLER